MEKKRKLPARAAARVEQMAKRRTKTPERRSETPAPSAPSKPESTSTSVTVQERPPSLPTSIQTGKLLPTVEDPQPEDLPAKDYQLVSESGVLSESLHRSRRKWISEGIFEKFWSKPYKRKGVVVEEPNNPPKECMTRIGQVTITVEPHVFEATMYAVKDPKPSGPVQPNANPATRPIMQYGPPNGVMRPPPPPPRPVPVTPSTMTNSPVPATTEPISEALPSRLTQPATTQHAQPHAQLAHPVQDPPTVGLTSAVVSNAPPHSSEPAIPSVAPQSQLSAPAPAAQFQAPVSTSASPAASAPRPAPAASPVPASQVGRSMSSPRGMESILSPSTVPAIPAPPPLNPPPARASPVVPPDVAQPIAAPSLSSAGPPMPIGQAPSSHIAPLARPVPASAPPATLVPTAPPPAAPATGGLAPGTDPIILMLAKRAGEDTELQDLMKRVAQGDASKPELERFQSIIDEITAESKRNGTTGPSAERLLVDGKSVRYFADEVRAILDIVLASNPRQTSATLRPPEGSDPLVVMLVKKTLDDPKTKELVRRIAENRPQFNDAADLKAVLEALKREIVRENERRKSTTHSPAPSMSGSAVRANGASTGHQAGTSLPPAAPQSLRSKGPPPVYVPPAPDISAVVFEFAGSNGDRYLFPKFSILEYVPVPSGQQVVASFLIVRRGSASEYPLADPTLDYYQPVTIRLYAPAGRHLENLSRVVAPREEVQRYMNDVMDKMTRAEYVLLAMRLPRSDAVSNEVDPALANAPEAERKDKHKDTDRDPKGAKDAGYRWVNNHATSGTTDGASLAGAPPTALWTTKPRKPEIMELPPRSKTYGKDVDAMDDDVQYQAFIASVSRKDIQED